MPSSGPRSSLAIRAAWAALPLATLGTYSGCTCRRTPTIVERQRDFGDLAAPIPDVRAFLQMARAIVDKRGRSAVPEPPGAPGRRVIVALWRAGNAMVASANGATLADAVATASERLSNQNADGGGRLELDIPTRADAASLDEDADATLSSAGLEGLLTTRDDGRTALVLPTEMVVREIVHARRIDHLAAARLLASRVDLPESDIATMRAYRFHADTHVESSDRSDALSVVRGMVEPPAAITPEKLLTAVRRGADYLVRIVRSSGRYIYMYHPVEDREDASYGWLRHSGTTYALFEAYEEFGTPSYLDNGQRALRYLATHLVKDASSQGKYVVDTDDEEQQKVGGAALALLAFSKHVAVTGNKDDPEALETMRALARFIIKQQYPDGHFRSNADVDGEVGKKLKREPVYYPGEAVLALMRLYAIDAQPTYLDAARRGADWIVHVRDAYVSEDNQEHDHWISYALNELYRVTRDEAYLDHAFKIARAIQRKQRLPSAATAPDLVGTFYDGQTTPASTRVEAYDADIVLSRFAGRPESWLMGPAREAARSILWQQFGPDNDYWLKNPAKADGGIRESPFIDDVRIDYVQHAMSAWLHLARILRDPAYGKTGIPSQDPVRPFAPERSLLH